MTNFHAIGYHGTAIDNVPLILSSIDYSLNQGDKFLGAGFYLWRDSYSRALKWSDRSKGASSVIRAEIYCKKDEMLNFTSKNWNDEERILDLYLSLSKKNQIYFGQFIDSIVNTPGMKLKLVTMFDMTKDKKTFKIEDGENITNFAYGDIQICVKQDGVFKTKLKEVNI